MPRQLKDGLWWSTKTRSYHYHVHLKNPADGRPHTLKGDTYCTVLSEAQHRKEEESGRWRRQAAGLPVAQRLPTLAQLHQRWAAEHQRSLSPRTLAAVEQRFRLHMQELLTLRIDEITTARVLVMRAAYLAGTKISSGTTRSKLGSNHLVAALRQVLGWAVRTELLPALPFRVPPLKDDPRVPIIVWPEQVEAFLKACQPRPIRVLDKRRKPGFELRRWDKHDAIMLQICAGLREGEAVGARWEWVDWHRELYTVGRSKNRKPREIPLEAGLQARLRTRWEASGRPTEGWILLGVDGRPHLPRFAHKTVASAGVALGVRGMTPHDLRRTFASALDEIGCSKGQIQLLMGHEDPSTTESYILRRPKAQEQAIQGLSRAYGLVPKVFPIDESTSSKPCIINRIESVA